MRGLNEYIVWFIADPVNSLNDLALATALAGAGHVNRPWWISSEVFKEAEKAEDEKELRREALRLQKAIDRGRLDAYLNAVREANVRAHRLPQR